MDPRIARGFYNSIEPERGEERRFVVDRVRPQLARIIRPGARVLDIGCGAGRFAFAAEEMGAEPVGIDCADVLLRHARQVAERRKSVARFVEGDYRILPFGRGSFDVALLMCNIVENSYDDMDRLLAQLRVILAQDGVLCFDMPDYLTQYQQGRRSLMEYDPSTGEKTAVQEIPGRGKFAVRSYFWTVAFAKHVCTRHLALYEDEPLEVGRHWLAFRNSL